MKRIFKHLIVMLAAVLLISNLSVGTVSAAAKPKLNKTKITLNVKKSYQLKLSNNSKKIKWYSSRKSVATVSSKGKVTAKKKGTATITAKVGSKKYNCKVTVKQPVTSLKMNKKSYTLKKKGSTVTLKASAKPSSANTKSVSWYSSNKKVATVSSKGKVKAVGNGTATITAKAKDGSGKKATCKIYVKIPSKKVTSVKLNRSSYTLKKKGSTVTLKATASPSSATNRSVSWSTSNKKVATVSSSGKVTAVGNGTATITATAKDGSKKKASCKITVKIPTVRASKVSLSKSSVSLTKKGQTYTLKATVSPSSTTNKAVAWKSSNTKVATVNSAGKITAVGNGSATISATTKDGSKKSASCKVTVKIPSSSKPTAPVKVSAVSLNKTSLKFTAKGQGAALSASVSPSNAANKGISWSSSNTGVATVNGSGYVTAVGNGTATITATAKDGSGKRATCSVTVSIPKPVEPETPQTETEKPQPPVTHVNSVIIGPYSSLSFTQKGETSALVAYVIPSNATNTSVRWSSSNNAVATVSSNGLVTAVGNGNATITLTSVDGGKTATCSVTVNIPDPKPDPGTDPDDKPTDPTKPAVENISVAGGDAKVLGFLREETNLSIGEFAKISFDVKILSGDPDCIEILGRDNDEYRQFITIDPHKTGKVRVTAVYNNTPYKTWNITITSNWDVYMRYENWKNGVKREICPSGTATVETLDALKNYIQTNFKYALGGPASNKYYAWEKMECDCVGASGMFGDIASDFGFKVKYVGSNGIAYDFITDAVSYSSGHVNNAVWINGSWVGYDAQPPVFP